MDVFACICVESKCVQFPKRPEGGNGSLGTGVAWAMGIKAGSSRKIGVHLTANPSLWPLCTSIVLFWEQNWGLNLEPWGH